MTMTQKDKQLLMKDLCGRLPYGVMCRLSVKDVDISITEKLDTGGLEHFIYGTMDVLPYLRPMSSMTEEEKDELLNLRKEMNKHRHPWIDRILDFYLSHHLDWRGLILLGLALEAPEGMYK